MSKWKENPLGFCFIKMEYNERKSSVKTHIDLHLPEDHLYDDALIVACENIRNELLKRKEQ